MDKSLMLRLNIKFFCQFHHFFVLYWSLHRGYDDLYRIGEDFGEIEIETFRLHSLLTIPITTSRAKASDIVSANPILCPCNK